MGYLPYNVELKAIFWIATMCFLAFDGILFVIKSIKTDKEKVIQRDFNRALGIFFFLCIGVGLYFILSDFERDIYGESELYFRLLLTSYIFGNLAFLTIIFTAERRIINTRYCLSYVTLFLLGTNVILMAFFPHLTLIIRYVNYGVNGTEIAILLCAYLYFIKKTSGELRRVTILTLTGITIASSAVLLQSDFLISSGLISPYISPIFFIVGLGLFAYETLRKKGLDILEMVAKHKMTTLTKDFWDIIEQFEWKSTEKKQFVKDMLGLTPYDRDELLRNMLSKFKHIE
jgi:hypothetical protein